MPVNRSIPHQTGVSLLFALLALVAMSLAAVALVRSVDTSSQVMGNLSFKQDATAAADKATKQAIALLTSGVNLNNNRSGGYYATAFENIDVTGQQQTDPARKLVNWNGDDCSYSPDKDTVDCTTQPSAEISLANGNKARYVIFRLCDATGDPNDSANSCARPLASSTSQASKRGKLDYSDYERFTNVAGIYYRIVVRVTGPRDTTSFVETIVHI